MPRKLKPEGARARPSPALEPVARTPKRTAPATADAQLDAKRSLGELAEVQAAEQKRAAVEAIRALAQSMREQHAEAAGLWIPTPAADWGSAFLKAQRALYGAFDPLSQVSRWRWRDASSEEMEEAEAARALVEGILDHFLEAEWSDAVAPEWADQLDAAAGVLERCGHRLVPIRSVQQSPNGQDAAAALEPAAHAAQESTWARIDTIKRDFPDPILRAFELAKVALVILRSVDRSLCGSRDPDAFADNLAELDCIVAAAEWAMPDPEPDLSRVAAGPELLIDWADGSCGTPLRAAVRYAAERRAELLWKLCRLLPTARWPAGCKGGDTSARTFPVGRLAADELARLALAGWEWGQAGSPEHSRAFLALPAEPTIERLREQLLLHRARVADRLAMAGVERDRGLTDVDDDEYRPAAWFAKGTAARLRMAAGKGRRSKRVRTRIIDRVVCYCVADVRLWWPDALPAGA